MNRRHAHVNQLRGVGLMRPLSLVVAVDEQGGFGKDGKIPWYYPEDLKRFKAITQGGACIMGRITYFDMYDMFNERRMKHSQDRTLPVPMVKNILPKRDNYVLSPSLSRQNRKLYGATVVSSIREAVERTKKPYIFIIGGGRLYNEALPWVNTIHMTVVRGTHDCDRFFPVEYVHKNFKIIRGVRGGDDTLFLEYRRKKI